MKNGLRPWIAGQPEKRAALVVASLSLILVAVAFVWPLTGQDQATSTTVEAVQETVTEKKVEPARRQAMPPLPTKSEPVKRPVPVEKATRKTAVPAPAPKPAAKPSAPQKETLAKGFYIQLGAFKDKQRAAILARRLSKSWSTHVVPRPKSLHAVWVGPYKSSALAGQDKTRIAKAEKINGFITQH